MPDDRTYTAEHTITVAAPARAVYDLLADVTGWPRNFAPTVHAERLDGDDRAERIQLWATANDSVKTWTSRRRLDPERLRIEFRQEVSAPPVAAMGGTWVLDPVSADKTEITLLHDFRAVDDDPEHVRWITEAVDRNSRHELAGLKAIVEGEDPELTFTFSDSEQVAGPVGRVYEFLYRADLWPERLPHVARLDLTEETPNIQLMAMDTSTKDGSVHTTRSVRVCFPEHRIVYKQIVLPALMSLHTGEWVLTEGPDGVLATSWHTVRIKPEAVPTILGPDATVADAKAFIRKALGTNSGTTLRHAKEYAEQA
ncbi:aromatase/cyclase [Micromonospora auratinigra]|uniref:Aromatase n=1 Tax=Micromonospora auratinigra TaxID=261654 RepID=A0A1A8ZGE4_9ACTN|nr:aromatase/cyclase [Micromonospora auratinigra]SBT42890.1 aromatase [Micromonospora auratinigra]